MVAEAVLGDPTLFAAASKIAPRVSPARIEDTVGVGNRELADTDGVDNTYREPEDSNRELADTDGGPTTSARRAIALEYLELAARHPPPTVDYARAHLSYFLGRNGATNNNDIQVI